MPRFFRWFSACSSAVSRSLSESMSSGRTLRYSASLRWVASREVSAYMGMCARWRLIHSMVAPDSVSATMALAPRWCAVNSAPMAIDWSMRL